MSIMSNKNNGCMFHIHSLHMYFHALFVIQYHICFLCKYKFLCKVEKSLTCHSFHQDLQTMNHQRFINDKARVNICIRKMNHIPLINTVYTRFPVHPGTPTCSSCWRRSISWSASCHLSKAASFSYNTTNLSVTYNSS